MLDAAQGSVVHSIRRLEELLQQMREAAKIIGEMALAERFEAAALKIKRGMSFAPSLYL